MIELSETQVLTLPPLKNLLLDFHPEQQALELSGYESHFGLRPGSKHWRKPMKGNGCFHITLHHTGKCRMHWDAWDPRRYPFRHFCELLYRYSLYPRLYLKDVEQNKDTCAIIDVEDTK